jgi:hypothetical protein
MLQISHFHVHKCIQWTHCPVACLVSGTTWILGGYHTISWHTDLILVSVGWLYNLYFRCFKCFTKYCSVQARLQNCRKRPLASSCLPVCTPALFKSAPMGRIFMKFYIWEFFGNLSAKCKFNSNLTRIMGTVHGDEYTSLIISCLFLLRLRNVSDRFCRDKLHFYIQQLFWKSCRLWGNVEKELERPQMTVWCVRISHCIPKATNTLLEYVLLIAFPVQQLLHECASMLHCTYFACLVYIKIYNIQLKYFSFRFVRI